MKHLSGLARHNVLVRPVSASPLQRARLAAIRGDYECALVDYQVGSLGPQDAADAEFVDDVFYLGLLKFKQQDATCCAYWAAAARHHQEKAKAYLAKYCQSIGKEY